MKKITALVFCIIMVVCLAACGSNNGTNAQNHTGTPNPTTEIASLEDLAAKMNCALVAPEGVSEEHFAVIDGTPTVGEYTFAFAGKPCTVRFANVDAGSDISGFYTDEGETMFNEYLNITDTVYIENDAVKAVRWFTVDGQYSLVLEDDGAVDWMDFEGLSNTFRGLTPVSWNSDVPYETYKAMEGYYQSENGELAGITIKIDHLYVFGVLSGEEGNYIWQAAAVLDGNKLVYDSESMTLNVYDANLGETTETQIFEGGAGSITVDGDTLIFDGVNCEKIAGISFTLSDM